MSHHAPDSVTADGLTAFLHAEIPLTRAMGLRAVEANSTRLILEAPLEPNRNHLGTAFGGSLHALPTLACYGALWMTLREAGIDGHVIVKHSEATYRTPVTDRIRATCELPSAALVADFLATLRRNKKARLELHAVVEGANGQPAVEFAGSFVAVI